MSGPGIRRIIPSVYFFEGFPGKQNLPSAFPHFIINSSPGKNTAPDTGSNTLLAESAKKIWRNPALRVRPAEEEISNL